MKVIKLIVYPPNESPIEHSAAPPDNFLEVVTDNDGRDIKLTVEKTVIKYVALPYQLQLPKPQTGKESPTVRVGGRAPD